VTPVTDKEVLEDNYGGEVLTPANVNLPRNAARPAKRFTNAYMLVYVRQSAMDEVLAPFTEGDTPPHLQKRLEDERLQLDMKKKEKEDQHLFLTAKIITDQTFKGHQGFDLATFEDKNIPASELDNFRVLKTETYKTFKQRIAQHYKYPEHQFRLWVLVNRQNKTVRPDSPIEDMDGSQSESLALVLTGVTAANPLTPSDMEHIRNQMANRTTELRLYLDFESRPELIQSVRPRDAAARFPHLAGTVSDAVPFPSQLHVNHNTYSMIFLKHFDVHHQTLMGVGKIYVNRGQKVGDLCATIQQMMGFPSSTPLRLYEVRRPLRRSLAQTMAADPRRPLTYRPLQEIKPGMIELMKLKNTFAVSEIQDGDVICFQVDIGQDREQDFHANNQITNAPQFYEHLQNRILVQFKPKYEDPDPKATFEVMLTRKMTYEQVRPRCARPGPMLAVPTC
jgi:ubiquitin carboxyl-terminal hydrolase 7